MSEILEYKVAMTCGGCSRAISALTKKVPGVTDVEADWETKTVVVKGENLDKALIRAAIATSGKEILAEPADDEE